MKKLHFPVVQNVFNERNEIPKTIMDFLNTVRDVQNIIRDM